MKASQTRIKNSIAEKGVTIDVGAGLSGRRIAAMVVNDNACEPDRRGALESIASKLAPTFLSESNYKHR